MTPRDRDVRDLLMRGFTNAEIGKQIGIKEGSVKRHIANLFQHYCVRSSDPTGNGSHRIRLAVAIFNAGDCPCPACSAIVRAPAAHARVPETMHMERGRPNSGTMLDLYRDIG